MRSLGGGVIQGAQAVRDYDPSEPIATRKSALLDIAEVSRLHDELMAELSQIAMLVRERLLGAVPMGPPHNEKNPSPPACGVLDGVRLNVIEWNQRAQGVLVNLREILAELEG